jgi:pimeloyl-ACP methyl ester carboxylesterase
MCDASLWQALLPRLQQLGQIHFADLNTGESIEAMAARALANLPTNCIVLGFSLGGYVAREIAVIASRQLAGVILLNTSARASSVQELKQNQAYISMIENVTFKGQTTRILQRGLHPDRQDNQALLSRLQAMSLGLGKQVFQRQLGLIRKDGYPDLVKITCPALVIASREDQMRTLDESEKLANGIPGAALAVIENCGHMSLLEQPQAVAEAIETWLMQLPKRAV